MTTTPTTVTIELDVLEVAHVVRAAILVYQAGVTIPGFSALLATWDTLVGADPVDESDPEASVFRILHQANAVINGTAVLTIKEA
jgi:hypothetical protein